jgi:hypothetical protein
MNESRFLLHRRALLAYNALTRSERDALDTAIARLVDQPETQWPAEGAVRLESTESLYMVRVDHSLRAIVRPAAGGQPEVLDLVRHETLTRFFQRVG